MSGVGLILLVSMSAAFFTLFERKLLAVCQIRVGPEKVWLSGILQPMGDAIKLLLKYEKYPKSTYKYLYFLTPAITLMISLVNWTIYPFYWGGNSWSHTSFFLLCLLSVSVYGTILVGWYSNSKFSLLGCTRAMVQSISYEVGLSLSIICLCNLYKSSSLECWPSYQEEVISISWMSIGFVLFCFIFLVETSRSPFDLSEAESELVSGFSVELGGLSYTFVFLAETFSLLWGSVVISCAFIGNYLSGWVFVLIVFVLIRAQIPRIRFDKLMSLFWIVILPLLFVCFPPFLLMS